MNYLGHSIVDEVGAGNGFRDLIPFGDSIYSIGSRVKKWYRLWLTNYLPRDSRSLPTHLGNGQFTNMVHPMRLTTLPNTYSFSNTLSEYITAGGNPIVSPFCNQPLSDLEYKGTYTYNIEGELVTISGVPSTTILFAVKIGNVTLVGSDGSELCLGNRSPLRIRVNGTINMLNDSGTTNTSFFSTMTVTYQFGSSYTYTKIFTGTVNNVDTELFNDRVYSFNVAGVILVPFSTTSEFRQYVGTLQCINSDMIGYAPP
jgi:hypothetical protein